MSTYDAGYDLELKRKQQLNVNGTSAPAQSSNPETITTVFNKNNAEEAAQKLGLTVEEYFEVINNPNFLNLSSEEQIKFISDYKASKTTQSVQTTSIQSQNAEIASDSEEVYDEAWADKEREYYEAHKSEYVTDENCHAKGEFVDGFDLKAYSKQSPKDLLRIYVLEYAKNKYTFGNDGNDDVSQDWNDLSEEDRTSLIEQSKKEVLSKYNIKSADDVTISKFTGLMSKLQTANYSEMKLDEFDKLSVEKQLDYSIDKLTEQEEFGLTGLMSENEKKALENNKFDRKAIEYALKEKDPTFKVVVCNDNKNHLINEYKINVPEARRKYMEYIDAHDNLTEEQKNELEQLKEFQGLLDGTYTRTGEQSLVEQEILEADNEFASRYDELCSKATTEAPLIEEKNKLLCEYIIDKYKDDPAALIRHMKDNAEVGNLDVSKQITRYILKNPETRQVLLQDPSSEKYIKYFAAANVGVINSEEATQELLDYINPPQLSPEEKDALSDIIIKNANDEQVGYECVGGVCLIGTSHKVQQKYVDRANACQEHEHSISAHRQVNRFASEETKDYAAVNIYKAPEEAQEAVAHIYSDNNAERTKLMINSAVVSKCGEKAQQGVFDTLRTNAEELLPEDDAIKTLNTLTDQIADCAVSNQLGMHKSIMSSKYEDVQTYAASNVYKYDKSVQADAIKVVYDSGNTKAIDAVNVQLNKCDAAAVQSIAKEVAVQLKAMEERHSQQVTNFIGEKLVSMDAAKDPAASSKWSVDIRQAKIDEYREKFIKSTPLEKFRMISSLQGVWQQEIIAQIAATCPELLASLISSMGADLFQLQLTPEVRNKIMLEMLRVPDMQANALEYFKDNPSAFSAGIKSTCAELLADRDDDALNSAVIRNALPASKKFITEPDDLYSGGKISNREYGSFKNLWKKDKNGFYVC